MMMMMMIIIIIIVVLMCFVREAEQGIQPALRVRRPA